MILSDFAFPTSVSLGFCMSWYVVRYLFLLLHIYDKMIESIDLEIIKNEKSVCGFKEAGQQI